MPSFFCFPGLPLITSITVLHLTTENMKVLEAAVEDIYQNAFQCSAVLFVILFVKAKAKQQEQKCLFLPDWA